MSNNDTANFVKAREAIDYITNDAFRFMQYDFKDILEYAMSAVDKQIPVSVVKEIHDNSHYYYCPCGYHFMTLDYSITEVGCQFGTIYNYCPACGQRVKLEENNDA